MNCEKVYTTNNVDISVAVAGRIVLQTKYLFYTAFLKIKK